MQRPKIAITLGDVAGIGPEVAARACADPAVRDVCRPVVVGDPAVLARALRLCGSSLPVRELDRISQATGEKDAVECWDPHRGKLDDIPPGAVDPRAGNAAYEWLVAAARAALNREVDAVTTAPISKAALALAGRHYPGHTEILAETCGVSDFAMMLYLPRGPAVKSPQGLGVAHVTLHTSLASVPRLLSTPGIDRTIALLDGFLRDLGCTKPRIGVCALNPHAGESGLFGDEEERVIAPAVRGAAARGIDATGPLPADALLRRAIAGEFDGVVAMYHDQGHIALKLAAFDSAVNITLGLPIVRTSPSHGTAFDIAWKGTASAAGMVEALRAAALLSAAKTDSVQEQS